MHKSDNNNNNCADYTLVKCNYNNTLKANPDDNTSKANPDDNTLKTNPALCKHTTIKTNAQIMYW